MFEGNFYFIYSIFLFSFFFRSAAELGIDIICLLFCFVRRFHGEFDTSLIKLTVKENGAKVNYAGGDDLFAEDGLVPVTFW